MKKAILLLALIGTIVKCFSQAKPTVPITKSNFETVSGASGAFSKKEIYLIGKVKGISVEAVKLSNIFNQQSISAIRISAYKSTSYGSDEKVSVLDIDEIDAYLKVLNYIQTNVINTPVPETSIEYNYYARGGFSSGAFNETKKPKWDIYLDLDKYSSATFYIDTEDLPALIDLISKAKAKLL